MRQWTTVKEAKFIYPMNSLIVEWWAEIGNNRRKMIIRQWWSSRICASPWRSRGRGSWARCIRGTTGRRWGRWSRACIFQTPSRWTVQSVVRAATTGRSIRPVSETGVCSWVSDLAWSFGISVSIYWQVRWSSVSSLPFEALSRERRIAATVESFCTGRRFLRWLAGGTGRGNSAAYERLGATLSFRKSRADTGRD